ncbi:hypothetical protein MRX96_046577 [Rhipicephalus microplus]
MKEEPGDHSVPGSYQPNQAKRRGRKKKTETALQSDYSVARTAVGMQPPPIISAHGAATPPSSHRPVAQ